MQATETSLVVHGILTGLPANFEGGWHIHTGFSCQESDLVGLHFFDSSTGPDPWNVIKYQSDADGVATISATMPGFSLDGAMAVLGRTVVVHGATKIGCGLILPSNAEIVTIDTCTQPAPA